jgi:hypothetical protein
MFIMISWTWDAKHALELEWWEILDEITLG